MLLLVPEHKSCRWWCQASDAFAMWPIGREGSSQLLRDDSCLLAQLQKGACMHDLGALSIGGSQHVKGACTDTSMQSSGRPHSIATHWHTRPVHVGAVTPRLLDMSLPGRQKQHQQQQ